MRLYIDATATPVEDAASAAWYGAAGGGACPIGDLTIDDTRNTADMRYRCSDVGYGLPAKRNPLTAEFRLIFGIDETLKDLIYDQMYVGPDPEVRLCYFCSDDISVTDATGIVIPMFCSAYPHDQPLEDVAGHDIVFTMGFMGDGVQPVWETVPIT